MTVTQLCKKFKIHPATITSRAKRLGLKKTRKKNDYYIYDFTKEEIKKLTNYRRRTVIVEKIKEVFIHNVEVIRIETVYYIYPSKINYLEVDISDFN
jgi:arginine repressor